MVASESPAISHTPPGLYPAKAACTGSLQPRRRPVGRLTGGGGSGVIAQSLRMVSVSALVGYTPGTHSER